jgi:hypothetical protein
MKRAATALLLCCTLFTSFLPADDIKLDVVGVGVKQVYVTEKVPFFVKGPEGGSIYQWQAPNGVTFEDLDEQIKVTKAPAGKLVFVVRVKTIDEIEQNPETKVFKIKKWKVDNGTIEVNFGGLTPPPPPVDPVDPVDPEAAAPSTLIESIKGAWLRETGPYKAQDMATYTEFVHGIVKALKNSGEVKNAADFQRLGRAAANQAFNLDLGNGNIRKGDDTTLANVRMAAGQFVAQHLALDPNTPVDETYWKEASLRYSQVWQAMKKAVK